MASEWQRLADAQAAQEGQLLAYEGSARDARCFDPGDELRLRAAVGAEWGALDRAVAVLRRAGMSTSSLRRAAAAGVDVGDAGRVNVAGLCFCCSLWLWSACLFASLPFGARHWLDACCAVLWGAAWLSLRRRDQRAFAASALAFFTACRLPVVIVGWTVLGGYRRRYYSLARTEKLAAQLLPWTAALSALQLLSLAVPLGAVASVPVMGPWLAHALLFRGCRGRLNVVREEGGSSVELAEQGADWN